MVARNGFVQMPPDTLDGIGLGSVLRQKVEHDSIAPSFQVIPNKSTVVKTSVVANHVNPPVAPQTATEVVQVRHKQGRVTLLPRLRKKQRSCPPVQRSSKVSFFVIPRGYDLALFSALLEAGRDDTSGLWSAALLCYAAFVSLFFPFFGARR